MIVINGKHFTEEDIAKMQEHYFRQEEERYRQWLNCVKCGYAMIPQTGVAICGLTQVQIDPNINCKQCAAYEEKVFEIISEERV